MKAKIGFVLIVFCINSIIVQAQFKSVGVKLEPFLFIGDQRILTYVDVSIPIDYQISSQFDISFRPALIVKEGGYLYNGFDVGLIGKHWLKTKLFVLGGVGAHFNGSAQDNLPCFESRSKEEAVYFLVVGFGYQNAKSLSFEFTYNLPLKKEYIKKSSTSKLFNEIYEYSYSVDSIIKFSFGYAVNF